MFPTFKDGSATIMIRSSLYDRFMIIGLEFNLDPGGQGVVRDWGWRV